MAKRTKYKESCHKRAFELYRELGSFYAVSKEKGMPSQMTVWRWSHSGFNCGCGYHGWEELEKQLRRDLQEQVKRGKVTSDVTDESIKPDLKEYIRADLEKLKVILYLENEQLKVAKASGVHSLECPKCHHGFTVQEALNSLDRVAILEKVGKSIEAGWRAGREIVGEEPPGGAIPIVLIRSKKKDADDN